MRSLKYSEGVIRKMWGMHLVSGSSGILGCGFSKAKVRALVYINFTILLATSSFV
jgi:hypothetical protein